MNTKGPLNPASDGNQYFYVIVDQFSNYFNYVNSEKTMLITLQTP